MALERCGDVVRWSVVPFSPLTSNIKKTARLVPAKVSNVVKDIAVCGELHRYVGGLSSHNECTLYEERGRIF